MKDGYLEFHFNHDFLAERAIAFSDPIKVLKTYKTTEVRDVLRNIESYVEKGFYAAGYISYEAAPAFHSEMVVHPDPQMPLVWFGIYTSPIEPKITAGAPGDLSLDWKMDTSKAAYSEAISHIRKEIEDGNTYQVNYTVRLTAKLEPSQGISLFHQLKEAQNSDYAAYLNLGEHQILSVSPELFFAWNGKKIVTKPMKGTIRRGLTPEEDYKNKEALFNSNKDRSENVMIVDLLRNDLSQLAKKGTVQVPQLFEIETYPTVYQMTSTIEAETKDEVSFVHLFDALFPCGSITGAPKVSTMKIIEELETSPREVYCGAIGFIQPNKTTVFNVPIRTVWVNHHTQIATYGVGGGVTWESSAEGEYEEVVTKGKVLTKKNKAFDLLESLLLENGTIFLLERHLQRLKHSGAYFGYPIAESEVRESLDKLSREHSIGAYKVRLLVNRTGAVYSEITPIQPDGDQLKVCDIALHPVRKEHVFLYHKTTERSIYKELRNDPSCYDTLLWNQEKRITEFTIGNVVLKIEGDYLTPPVEDGLLAGTFRDELINRKTIKVHSLTLDDLIRAEEVWLINSVRKWVKVEINFT